MYHHQPSILPPTSTHHHPTMGVHGNNVLEVTVVGCNKLKDTEWISRQDPYVCLEYGNSRNRTRVCTDGGKNPTFQEKFVYSAIEGLRELNINVWNSNTISRDDFISSGNYTEEQRLKKVEESPHHISTSKFLSLFRIYSQSSNIRWIRVPFDSTAQTGNPNAGDWQSEVYQKIKAMK
ncbi:hypothetical protein L1987_55215 [Smallanthus sonchifolius]|uniref:Uncharacterized protein n=1 Tax=Smallanthus sonchifolius TaxID=185202 RepID=A0ACB9E9B7_9ASTR|nr:hypothetical protein L1987_55215 [Smallanthus sonchifolius]